MKNNEKKEKKEKTIYERLAEDLPPEAIQRTFASDTKKGYDTTGYGYQFVVNRFNEVLGIENWGFDWEIIKEQEGTFKSGIKNFEVTIKMTIWCINKETTRTCVGSHLSSSYGDALKGAITNAFKKTASFFGVGRKAFEGMIDEDNQPRKEGENDRVYIKPQTQVTSPTPTISQTTPAHLRRPTEAQIQLYKRIISSSVWNEAEKKHYIDLLPTLSFEKISSTIEYLLAEEKRRKNRKKKEVERKEEPKIEKKEEEKEEKEKEEEEEIEVEEEEEAKKMLEPEFRRTVRNMIIEAGYTDENELTNILYAKPFNDLTIEEVEEIKRKLDEIIGG